MYRIVCKMGIASIQGHGTSAYLPRRRNLHFFFPFFFITVLLSRPSHHTGTQDLCSLVYNSSMKNSMLITDHPRSKYILSPPYLFFLQTLGTIHPARRYSDSLAYSPTAFLLRARSQNFIAQKAKNSYHFCAIGDSL